MISEKLKKYLRYVLILGPRSLREIWRLCSPMIISDELYLKVYYFLTMDRPLHLDNPQTLNEKMQWLKLYDRKEQYTLMADKYAARKFIADRVGEEYLVPLCGVWDSAEQIDWESLPEKFVLKCTHDSHSVFICTDKKVFDRATVIKKIKKAMKHNFYWLTREWPYKNIQPRIIAEKYLVDESGWELKDYKIFCFNGEPQYVEVDFNRFVSHRLNPYDLNWNPLNFCDSSPNDWNADIPKPKKLDEMLNCAKVLSAGIPLLRVDFYSIGEKIYCGELTFYPGGGMIHFKPSSVDLEFGKRLKLPAQK